VKRETRSETVPLMQQLSNVQFLDTLDILLQKCQKIKTEAVSLSLLEPANLHVCKCRCGRPVEAGRTFVNQAHYNIWLSRERYWGKNRRNSH
jgi:hypothetical protein